MARRRRLLGLSQTALGEKVGLSRDMIARIEGRTVDPSVASLRRLAEALDFNVPRAMMLLDEVEGPTPAL